MAILIKSIVIRQEVPEGFDGSLVDTEVIVDDEGGGPFLTIRQDGLQDWLTKDEREVPQIRIDFAEVEELYEVMKALRDEWKDIK